MSLSNILKKTTDLLYGCDIANRRQYNHGDIIFSKNNVCVHPGGATLDSNEIHCPGYLQILCERLKMTNTSNRLTLRLKWIPNATVRRNSDTLKKYGRSSSCSRPTKKLSLYASRSSSCSRFTDNSDSTLDNLRSLHSNDLSNQNQPNESSMKFENGSSHCEKSENQDENENYHDCKLSEIWRSPKCREGRSCIDFPESAASSPVKNNWKPVREFSVDLSEMKSLRLFFDQDNLHCGQLVIASRECQYKILHFHHGGLDKLSETLHQWNLFPVNSRDGNYKQFMIYQPQITDSELHPEEGAVLRLTVEIFWNFMNDVGQIEDDLSLRKAIFFNGLPKELRCIVWPFLLNCYSFQTTSEDREEIRKIRKYEYKDIRTKAKQLCSVDEERLKNIDYIIEKDVVRTDRSNPFYAGAENPNLNTMKNILLNYAIFDQKHGYTQGMSDLLAPVLAEIQDESETFWCFVGIMRRGFFVCTPTDSDMEKNINYFRELIRIMYPKFYRHLEKFTDGTDLLFCHRWLLLCFKREFPEEIAMQIWEACWSNYLTDYFHLFVSLAIVIVYSDDIFSQDLSSDEILFHFSSLAMFMDGPLILRKARGLVHSFRLMPKVPCTLANLCEHCGSGIWDSRQIPNIECVGNPICMDDTCPFKK